MPDREEAGSSVTGQVKVRIGPSVERCPACRSEAFDQVREDVWPGIGLSRCATCGTEFQDPQPSDERLVEIYGPSYYEPWTYEDADVVKRMKQLTFEPALDACGLAPGAHVLDVGCATGDLAALVASRGFDAYGIDLNGLAIERARAAVPTGHFHVGVLADEPFAGRMFDAITMFDFIEHVREPGVEVEAAAARLADGGHLIISTPRVDSATRRVTRRNWPQYREEHLTYFTTNGMRTMLASAGLDVVGLRSTKKYLTPAYLYGQAIGYPVPLVTPVVKATWRFLPVPKHHPIGFRFGEMTVLARRRRHRPS
jgi:2-polyprenyl-3-methyl-5-hydroxy-6-metoxy-1,4-benzoquinol methylase